MTSDHNPLVYVVVLHWKNYVRTRGALGSIAQISYSNYRVIVVDNSSNDDSVEKLQSEFPQHVFIRNEENLGFSKGCNPGIRAAYSAGADYVLLLNNDMEVERGFLESAVAAAEQDAAVGLVTGKILFGDQRNVIWQAGGKIDRLRVQGIPRAWNQTDRGQYDAPCETGWASGAMLLVPRQTIEKVGLLPEEYFFGVEEWEYSTSVRKRGLKILYVPSFKAYHYAGGSYQAGHPVLIVYNGFRNKLIFAQKHLSPPAWFLWKMVFRGYLRFWWPRRAGWGCQTEQDYQARLKAARLALSDHRGIFPILLSDLERAAKLIGPTPTWGRTWAPTGIREAE